MMLKKILFLGLCTLGFAACESSEDKTIASAQACLNTATAATVDGCVAMVAGVKHNQANKIRCSADFIRAGIDEDTIVDALKQLDGDKADPNKSATTTFFSFFRFDDAAKATQAVANCTSTGSNTLRDLANAAKTATHVFLISGGAADLQTWADGLTTNDINNLDVDELVAIGETVIALQPSLCGPSGQFENNKVCLDLNAAIVSGDANQIAKDLLAKLKEHN